METKRAGNGNLRFSARKPLTNLTNAHREKAEGSRSVSDLIPFVLGFRGPPKIAQDVVLRIPVAMGAFMFWRAWADKGF